MLENALNFNFVKNSILILIFGFSLSSQRVLILNSINSSDTVCMNIEQFIFKAGVKLSHNSNTNKIIHDQLVLKIVTVYNFAHPKNMLIHWKGNFIHIFVQVLEQLLSICQIVQPAHTHTCGVNFIDLFYDGVRNEARLLLRVILFLVQKFVT